MKLKVLTLLSSLTFCGLASATTVTFATNPTLTSRFQDSGGNFLADGSLVRLGTMSGNDPSTFQVFAESAVGSFAGNPGYVTGSYPNAAASAFNDAPIALWIFSDSAGNGDAAIFRAVSPATASGEWVYPLHTGNPLTDGTTISVLDIDRSAAINPFTGAVVAATVIDGGVGLGGGMHLGLFAVPEPSVTLMSLFGAVSLLFVRRRK